MILEIEKSIEEIKLFFGPNIEITPLDDGGACVIVNDIQLNEKYVPQTTWVGFIVTFQYPRADVYPHYIDSSIKRSDGSALGGGFSNADWKGKSCIQISRRSNKLDPSIDTAATKLAKVVEWIKSR